jgi:citrate lyase gamma subunit
VFLCCLSESRELLPDVDLLLQAAEKIHPANRKPVHMMLLLLMMASSVAKQPTAAVSQQILDMAVTYFEKCQVEIGDRSAASCTVCVCLIVLN